MLKAYKYKLYRSKRQRKLHRLVGIAARIWNHSVAILKRYYRLTGKSLDFNRLKRHIGALRKRTPACNWIRLRLKQGGGKWDTMPFQTCNWIRLRLKPVLLYQRGTTTADL